MISIKFGYRNNIDTSFICHPANCKLLPHNDNISKHDKCSISLDVLKERIENCNKKYIAG